MENSLSPASKHLSLIHLWNRFATFCGTQVDILAEMNSFNIEGRDPDTLSLPLSQEEAQEYINRADEVFQWLMNLL